MNTFTLSTAPNPFASLATTPMVDDDEEEVETFAAADDDGEEEHSHSIPSSVPESSDEEEWTTVTNNKRKTRQDILKDVSRRSNLVKEKTIVWNTLSTCPHDKGDCPQYLEGRGRGEIDPETGELYPARPYIMKMIYFDRPANKVVCRCRFCEELVYLDPVPYEKKTRS